MASEKGGYRRRTLGLATLISLFQFAPFFPRALAAVLIKVRAPLPVDFPSFYYAAAAYRAGANPYDLSVVGRAATNHAFPFLYPPTSLPIFLPLTLMRIDLAALVFQLASFFCLLYVAYAVLQMAEDEWPLSWQAVTVVALASFQAIGLTFLHGQVNLMATAAVLFAWREIRNDARNPMACAMALFAASLLKTYPALLLIAFIIRGEVKVVAWFVVLGLVDLMVSWFTIPLSVWRTWLVSVVPSGHFGTTPHGLFAPSAGLNQSLNGAFSRLIGEGPTARMEAPVQLFLLAVVVLVCWFSRRDDRMKFYDTTFSVIIVAAFLIAPLSWFHHFVFLIPALTAYAAGLRRSEWRDSRYLQIALLCTTVLLAIAWPEFDTARMSARLVMTVPIIGPLALFALCAIPPEMFFRVRDTLQNLRLIPAQDTR